MTLVAYGLRQEQHDLLKRRIKLFFLYGAKAKRLSFEGHPPERPKI